MLRSKYCSRFTGRWNAQPSNVFFDDRLLLDRTEASTMMLLSRIEIKQVGLSWLNIVGQDTCDFRFAGRRK